MAQSVRGTGPRAGLAATPRALDFEPVTVGSSSTLTVNIVNTEGEPTTVGEATLPTGAFRASGVPAPGIRIPAGGSVSVSVTYSPTAPGPSSATLRIASADGR